MSAFSLRFFFDDIWQQLRTNKRRVLLCCLVTVAGVALGVVLFGTSQMGWWYANRCNFVFKLLYGGFFEVLVSCVVSATVISLLLCLCSVWQWTRFLCYPILVIVSMYFGAHCCAICSCAGFLGVLYLVFFLLTEQLLNMLCCFCVVNNCACRNTFREAVRECRIILILQIAGILAKMLIIFLLLRLLTASI